MDSLHRKLYLHVRKTSPEIARIENAIEVLYEMAADIRSDLLKTQDERDIYDVRMMSEPEHKKMAEFVAIKLVTKLAIERSSKIAMEEVQKLNDTNK